MPGSSKPVSKFTIDENYISKSGSAKSQSMNVQAESKVAAELKAIIDSTDEESKDARDDFAILEEDTEGMTKDKRLLVTQMRGLFNSIPIRIEEKGYLIQLMHTQDMRVQMADILSEVTQNRLIQS